MLKPNTKFSFPEFDIVVTLAIAFSKFIRTYSALRWLKTLKAGRSPAFNVFKFYADGETRTLTSKILEPKSSASTNSATSA